MTNSARLSLVILQEIWRFVPRRRLLQKLRAKTKRNIWKTLNPLGARTLNFISCSCHRHYYFVIVPSLKICGLEDCSNITAIKRGSTAANDKYKCVFLPFSLLAMQKTNVECDHEIVERLCLNCHLHTCFRGHFFWKKLEHFKFAVSGLVFVFFFQSPFICIFPLSGVQIKRTG